MPLYRGWSIVLACGIIATFSWGLGFYGLGVYLHALNRLHGWSPGLISVAVTVYYALSAVFIVMVGGLIDRRGPRGVLTYGVRPGHRRGTIARRVRPEAAPRRRERQRPDRARKAPAARSMARFRAT